MWRGAPLKNRAKPCQTVPNRATHHPIEMAMAMWLMATPENMSHYEPQ
jgi:hypothetical protein